MSGAGVQVLVQTEGLKKLADRVNQLGAKGQAKLLKMIAALHQNQVETRIMEDKTGPDGKDWPKWSPGYEKTRDSRHSLLMSGDAEREGKQTHSLHSSIITQILNEAAALVGSPLIYAATIQHGDSRLAWGKHPAEYPARPFLGFSDANYMEVESVIGDWLDKQLGAA